MHTMHVWLDGDEHMKISLLNLSHDNVIGKDVWYTLESVQTLVVEQRRVAMCGWKPMLKLPLYQCSIFSLDKPCSIWSMLYQCMYIHIY